MELADLKVSKRSSLSSLSTTKKTVLSRNSHIEWQYLETLSNNVFSVLGEHCGNFGKRWEYQTTWPASWETCMQVRKQQLELDMEQQTGSKQEKEYVKAAYCHPAYLTYVQSTSWEMLGCRKLEAILASS